MFRAKKLFESANVSRSYSKNNTGTVFLRHGVLHHSTEFAKATPPFGSIASCMQISSVTEQFCFCSASPSKSLAQ